MRGRGPGLTPAGPAPEELIVDALGLPFDSRRDEVLRGRIWAPVLKELPSWALLCTASAGRGPPVGSRSPSRSRTRLGQPPRQQNRTPRVALRSCRHGRCAFQHSTSERRPARI